MHLSRFLTGVATAFLLIGTVRAAVPTTMNIQGRLTDSSDAPLAAGVREFTFRIYDAQSGGNLIWSEASNDISSDAGGLWNATLGGFTPLTPSVFVGTSRWLDITVVDGEDPVTLPRVPLITTPYTFHADHASYADTAGISLAVVPDDDWLLSDSLLETVYQRGIVRGASDNHHHGTNAQTVVNLGVACTTSMAGGGSSNVTIGGGLHNVALRSHSTIGGGRDNIATGNQSTISGGGNNSADGSYTTVGGGNFNGANAEQATVSGGGWNLADGSYSTVGGGVYDTADGTASTVAGGFSNTASGSFATIPGGANNDATGSYSFAAGRRARAIHEGAFVWADATDADQSSAASNTFTVYASGGINLAGPTEITHDDPNQFALYVDADDFAGAVARISAGTSVSSGEDILELNTSNAINMQFIECEVASDPRFRVWGDGDVTADGTITGGGADFAEILTVSTGAESVEPGDVMTIDPNNPRALIQSAEPRSTLVAGVYSTRPGFLASNRDWDQIARHRGLVKTSSTGEDESISVLETAAAIGEVPVAVVGIVPCKVTDENGPIRPGDLLVTSSTQGHAMRDSKPDAGTILGKALGSLESGYGVIEVLVTLQ